MSDSVMIPRSGKLAFFQGKGSALGCATFTGIVGSANRVTCLLIGKINHSVKSRLIINLHAQDPN